MQDEPGITFCSKRAKLSLSSFSLNYEFVCTEIIEKVRKNIIRFFQGFLLGALNKEENKDVGKGQLISKTIYGVLDSPKKNKRKPFDLLYHSTMIYQVKWFLFVFLEKLGKQKLLSRLSDL